MEDYLGIIKLFAGNFAPRNWLFCSGQELAIAQNQALFSLLGTTYGGNGMTTFKLPDYRGRIAIGMGQSAYGTYYPQGQVSGTPTTTLTLQNMPAHLHPVPASGVEGQVNFSISDVQANALTGKNNAFAQASKPFPNSSAVPQVFDNAPTFAENNYLHASSVDTVTEPVPASNTNVSGGSQPFSLLNPYLALNYIICVAGIYPSRS